MVNDGLMRHDYKENKGDDGLMCCTLRANQPLIRHEVIDVDMIGCYHDKNEEDDRSMQYTHRAGWPLI
eukprot:13619515-Ditylum_brightwellii.AAC.1